VLCDDIDWPYEFNEVYLNGHKLEETIGESNLINSTTFVIPDVSWVQLGNNLVQIQVDVHLEGYGPIVYNGQIVTDFAGGSIGDASIRSLDVNPTTVGYNETLTVTMEVDTSLISQDVRLELVLRDADGTAIAFDTSSEAREWTVNGSEDEPHEWVVTLPASGTDRIWTLTAAVYDINSDEFSDYEAKVIVVPDISSVQPVIGGVSPAEGYAEAAVVITGTNFIPGDTTCTIGGLALQNQVVLNSNTVTDNISDTLTIGSHDVVCTTSYGSDTLTNGFALLNTPPIAIYDSGSTAENVALVLSVLDNDYDANNDTLSISAIGNPLHGTATISGTTQVVYTPTLSFSGADSFTYTASDGSLTDTVIIYISVGPLVYNAPGGGDLTLIRNGTDLQILDSTGPGISQSFTLAPHVVIIGADGVDNLLTIDFSGGDPLPSGGITYDGGVGGNDTLALTDGSVDIILHGFLSQNSGFIDIDGKIIHYSGLEPVGDTLIANTRIFTFTIAAGNVTLSDDGITNNNTSRISSSSGETTDFATPNRQLVLRTGGGNDVITFAGLDGQFATLNPIVIDGEAPVSPASPGDTLNHTVAGGTLINTGTGEGYIYRNGANTIRYLSIETLNGVTDLVAVGGVTRFIGDTPGWVAALPTTAAAGLALLGSTLVLGAVGWGIHRRRKQ
jgi:hypothetical protein